MADVCATYDTKVVVHNTVQAKPLHNANILGSVRLQFLYAMDVNL